LSRVASLSCSNPMHVIPRLRGGTHAQIVRTKVIGRFPGETSCLTLVWAVLDLY
jgi:hypothetical protein